jgi:hypothetical protein
MFKLFVITTYGVHSGAGVHTTVVKFKDRDLAEKFCKVVTDRTSPYVGVEVIRLYEEHKVTIKNAEPMGDVQLERLRRKRDQAWDMAGLARKDGDEVAEQTRTEEARNYECLIREYLS